jgi:phage shock protein A
MSSKRARPATAAAAAASTPNGWLSAGDQERWIAATNTIATLANSNAVCLQRIKALEDALESAKALAEKNTEGATLMVTDGLSKYSNDLHATALAKIKALEERCAKLEQQTVSKKED